MGNIYFEAYDDMMGALARFNKALGETNAELASQVKAMQEAMDDDYGDELCEKVGKFIDRIDLYRDDVIEVQRALDNRMKDLFG